MCSAYVCGLNSGGRNAPGIDITVKITLNSKRHFCCVEFSAADSASFLTGDTYDTISGPQALFSYSQLSEEK